MVVFTCNHCGDSLQKPTVEKHYTFSCRTLKFLTCVDCLKDFRGEEYAVHTKCLTEDERYAAKGSYGNGIIKKGEVKQESWVEMVKSILDNDIKLKPSSRNLLTTISSYNNIPRKKPKFINFIKSASGGRVNLKDIEEVWNIIEKYKHEKAKTGNTNSNNGSVNSEDGEKNGDSEEKNLKNSETETKKRKRDEEMIDSSQKEQKNEMADTNLEQSVLGNRSAGENTDNAPKKKNKRKTGKKQEMEAENIIVQSSKVHKKKEEHNQNINNIRDSSEKVNYKKKDEEVLGDSPKKKKKQKTQNENTDDTSKETGDLKSEEKDDSAIQQGDAGEESIKFNFQKRILEIVSASGSISLKKLQKKVLNAYLKTTGQAEVTPKIIKKFNKKLKKISNLEVDDDRVTLLEEKKLD